MVKHCNNGDEACRQCTLMYVSFSGDVDALGPHHADIKNEASLPWFQDALSGKCGEVVAEEAKKLNAIIQPESGFSSGSGSGSGSGSSSGSGSGSGSSSGSGSGSQPTSLLSQCNGGGSTYDLKSWSNSTIRCGLKFTVKAANYRLQLSGVAANLKGDKFSDLLIGLYNQTSAVYALFGGKNVAETLCPNTPQHCTFDLGSNQPTITSKVGFKIVLTSGESLQRILPIKDINADGKEDFIIMLEKSRHAYFIFSTIATSLPTLCERENAKCEIGINAVLEQGNGFTLGVPTGSINSIVVADIPSHGKPSIIVSASSTVYLHYSDTIRCTDYPCIRNMSTAEVHFKSNIISESSEVKLATTDIDGDTFLDLVIGTPSQHRVDIWFGGNFSCATPPCNIDINPQGLARSSGLTLISNKTFVSSGGRTAPSFFGSPIISSGSNENTAGSLIIGDNKDTNTTTLVFSAQNRPSLFEHCQAAEPQQNCFIDVNDPQQFTKTFGIQLVKKDSAVTGQFGSTAAFIQDHLALGDQKGDSNRIYLVFNKNSTYPSCAANSDTSCSVDITSKDTSVAIEIVNTETGDLPIGMDLAPGGNFDGNGLGNVLIGGPQYLYYVYG